MLCLMYLKRYLFFLAAQSHSQAQVWQAELGFSPTYSLVVQDTIYTTVECGPANK